MSAFTTAVHLGTGAPSQSNYAGKRSKRNSYWKGRSKLSLLRDDTILCIENSKESTKRKKKANRGN